MLIIDFCFDSDGGHWARKVKKKLTKNSCSLFHSDGGWRLLDRKVINLKTVTGIFFLRTPGNVIGTNVSFSSIKRKPFDSALQPVMFQLTAVCRIGNNTRLMPSLLNYAIVALPKLVGRWGGGGTFVSAPPTSSFSQTDGYRPYKTNYAWCKLYNSIREHASSGPKQNDNEPSKNLFNNILETI